MPSSPPPKKYVRWTEEGYDLVARNDASALAAWLGDVRKNRGESAHSRLRVLIKEKASAASHMACLEVALATWPPSPDSPRWSWQVYEAVKHGAPGRLNDLLAHRPAGAELDPTGFVRDAMVKAMCCTDRTCADLLRPYVNLDLCLERRFASGGNPDAIALRDPVVVSDVLSRLYGWSMEDIVQVLAERRDVSWPALQDACLAYQLRQSLPHPAARTAPRMRL